MWTTSKRRPADREPVQEAPPRALWKDSLGVAATRAAQIILIVVIAVAAVWVMVQLKLVVIPILIALIIASAMAPVVNALHRRKMPRMLGTWIVLLGSIIVFGGIVTAIVFAVRAEWSDLVDQATDGVNTLTDWLAGLSLPIDSSQIENIQQSVVDFVTSSQFGSGAIAGVGVVGEVVTGLILVIVLLFFFLKDGDRIWAFLTTPLRGEHDRKAQLSGKRVVEVLGSYVRGTSIVAAVDAVVIGIALVIMQVPLALPLAVIVFIGAYIPLVGATVAGILAALVALVANGPVIALIVIVVVIAVNQLEGDLLQPVVMGKSLKLHALVILLALTIGTIVGGIIGAVLAVPIAASAWAVVKIWFGDRVRATGERTPVTR